MVYFFCTKPRFLIFFNIQLTHYIFCSQDCQSIEDLYIDDDFCQGMCLAANMKLVTNSNDTLGLDNIDFDIVSMHVYEETSESVMTNQRDNDDDQIDTKNQDEV